MKFKLILAFSLSISISSVFSQDALFSQPFVGNVNFNSALAGNDTSARFASNYRYHWNEFGRPNATSSINFYQYIPKLNAYGGVNFLNDNQRNQLKKNSFSLFYNQNLKIGKVLFRPSIELGYVKTTLDLTGYIYGDMIHPQTGFAPTTEEKLKFTSKYLNLNLGGIFYFKNLLVGFSMHQPYLLNVSGNSKLPIRYNWQLSYAFNFEKFRLSPYCIVDIQKHNDPNIIIGLDVLIKKHFNFALATRFDDAIILNFGYQNKFFALNYSYDFTTNWLNNSSVGAGGTHELGLALKFWKVRANPKFMAVNSVF